MLTRPRSLLATAFSIFIGGFAIAATDRSIDESNAFEGFAKYFLEMTTLREYAPGEVFPVVKWEQSEVRVVTIYEPTHIEAANFELRPVLTDAMQDINTETGLQYQLTSVPDNSPPHVIIMYGTPAELENLVAIADSELGIEGLTDLIRNQVRDGLPQCVVGARWIENGPLITAVITIEINNHVDKCVRQNLMQSLGFFADLEEGVSSVMKSGLDQDTFTEFDRLAMRVLYSGKISAGDRIGINEIAELTRQQTDPGIDDPPVEE